MPPFANDTSANFPHGTALGLPPGWWNDTSSGNNFGRPPWWNSQGGFKPPATNQQPPARVSTQSSLPPGPAAPTPPQMGTYATGISAGNIPQSLIDKQASYFAPQHAGPLNLGSGPQVSPNAQEALQGQYGSLLQALGTSGQWDFRRQAAEKQAQLGLQGDTARADAARQAFSGMLGGYGNDIEGQLSQAALDQQLRNMLLQFTMGVA